MDRLSVFNTILEDDIFVSTVGILGNNKAMAIPIPAARIRTIILMITNEMQQHSREQQEQQQLQQGWWHQAEEQQGA